MYSRPCRLSIQEVSWGRGISPTLTSVTRILRLTRPVTSSRAYIHTPLKVSAVTSTCISGTWDDGALRAKAIVGSIVTGKVQRTEDDFESCKRFHLAKRGA